jgi:hypothetical protein
VVLEGKEGPVVSEEDAPGEVLEKEGEDLLVRNFEEVFGGKVLEVDSVELEQVYFGCE